MPGISGSDDPVENQFFSRYNPYLGPQGSTSTWEQYTNTFNQIFQNLTGQSPTQDQTDSFMNQAVLSLPHADQLNYSDISSLVNNFVQNQYSPQIAQHSQQQQTSQLGNTEGTIQDLINKTMGNTATAISDPLSPIYQAFSGSMNNLGIIPSSGAFQAGAGSTIANAGLGAANQALQSVGIPTAQSIQGMSTYPLSTASNNSNLSNVNSLSAFGVEEPIMAQYAQQLQSMMQPSAFQQDIGMAGSAGQALGGLGNGLAGAHQATSYVCKELIKRGLLCEMDMDDFHAHIMPAMFKKGRAFWKYAMDGKKLVDAVNARGLDWKVFKPLLFDRVMEEPNSCKSVDLYADACHQLCISSDSSLWDERVHRESFWDSLMFLPRLLCYPPFLKALAKCVRIKLSVVHDRPRCSHAS